MTITTVDVHVIDHRGLLWRTLVIQVPNLTSQSRNRLYTCLGNKHVDVISCTDESQESDHGLLQL